MALFNSRRARKWTIGVAVGLVAVLVAGVLLDRVVNSRTFQFFGEIIDRVDATEKLVALTFDDGPHPAGARATLDALRERGVPATFFLTGRELTEHPELGREIAAAGHEIGNHSFAHERMVFVTPGWVAAEIESTDAAIRATGYQGEIHFRPPNGKKLLALPHYLSEHQRKTITWDVEPDSDSAVGDAAAIVGQTVERVRPGSIVLLHSMYPSREHTRAAIGPIIDQLTQRGYRFVTVSQLLAEGR
jgi:peptidoglycan/xylan/chitin deacetylase (PgdA/CDA1 family)